MTTAEGTVRMYQKSRKKKKKGKGGKNEKKGFMANLAFGTSDDTAVTAQKGPTVEWPMEFWDTINKPAKEDHYSPPQLDDFGFFKRSSIIK